MSNVLGFLTTPQGSVVLTIAVAVLTPLLGWPVARLLDLAGRAQGPAQSAGRDSGDRNHADVRGDGNQVAQVIDNSRTNVTVDTGARRPDDGSPAEFIAVVLFAAAVAVGAFISVGVGPFIFVASIALGVSLATVGAQFLRRRLTAVAVANLLAAMSTYALARRLPRAELDGRTWQETNSRLEQHALFSRFFEMTQLEFELVVGVLVGGLAISGGAVLIVWNSLGEWSLVSGAQDPVRRWLTAKHPSGWSHILVVAVLLALAVFAAELDGVRLVAGMFDGEM